MTSFSGPSAAFFRAGVTSRCSDVSAPTCPARWGRTARAPRDGAGLPPGACAARSGRGDGRRAECARVTSRHREVVPAPAGGEARGGGSVRDAALRERRRRRDPQDAGARAVRPALGHRQRRLRAPGGLRAVRQAGVVRSVPGPLPGGTSGARGPGAVGAWYGAGCGAVHRGAARCTGTVRCPRCRCASAARTLCAESSSSARVVSLLMR